MEENITVKHIYLNLKRFDIPKEYGGINAIAPIKTWGEYIVKNTQQELKKFHSEDVEFAIFFPEAHLITAINALCEDSPIQIGSQGVFRSDTAVGGNFGAFTSNRTGNAVKAIGCGYTIIGHCEERKDIEEIMKMNHTADYDAINRIMNQEIKAAINAELKVLYCIGERAEEQENWEKVLRNQLSIGLEGVDLSMVTIAYEPVWAIGPGKTPPDREYIQKVASFIKEMTKGIPVVYGGGLKTDNAKMLSSIAEIDGGLIALTRFTGEIGFYPEEYLEIINTYMENDL